ncbi:uncharacterized protein B0T15DRAFT_7553 [Chaetomium strumarium]|uniref:Uncharacterized protein n=1 Tax=Chaetomium strumarium TaxID=1170767 RepID=A0AAJ0H0J2_9PEZI|nr:hypothetical protein B0T15DRAFT_7553 [Chaetomium strumarium]
MARALMSGGWFDAFVLGQARCPCCRGFQVVADTGMGRRHVAVDVIESKLGAMLLKEGSDRHSAILLLRDSRWLRSSPTILRVLGQMTGNRSGSFPCSQTKSFWCPRVTCRPKEQYLGGSAARWTDLHRDRGWSRGRTSRLSGCCRTQSRTAQWLWLLVSRETVPGQRCR